jgi:hypothetical protein
MNEVEERMRGFQERYTGGVRTAAGKAAPKVLQVSNGTEHMERHGSYEL